MAGGRPQAAVWALPQRAVQAGSRFQSLLAQPAAESLSRALTEGSGRTISLQIDGGTRRRRTPDVRTPVAARGTSGGISVSRMRCYASQESRMAMVYAGDWWFKRLETELWPCGVVSSGSVEPQWPPGRLPEDQSSGPSLRPYRSSRTASPVRAAGTVSRKAKRRPVLGLSLVARAMAIGHERDTAGQ